VGEAFLFLFGSLFRLYAVFIDRIMPENPAIRPGLVFMDRLATLLSGVSIGAVEAGPVAGLCFWLRPVPAGLEVGIGLTCPADARLAAGLDWPSGTPLWGGGAVVRVLLATDGVYALAALLRDEAARPRCGASSLLAAYVEGLLVHLLRGAIEGGQGGVGLLAGLAEPRLARAIVAMHERPAQLWTVEDLAEVSGMSRSSFMERFRAVLGQTPMAYLRGWRMGQAQAELLRGARVAEVARRYGYRNSDAFARAYQGQFGQAPSAAKRALGPVSA
jgi:AraC-like DNA-binding protein